MIALLQEEIFFILPKKDFPSKIDPLPSSTQRKVDLKKKGKKNNLGKKIHISASLKGDL